MASISADGKGEWRPVDNLELLRRFPLVGVVGLDDSFFFLFRLGSSADAIFFFFLIEKDGDASSKWIGEVQLCSVVTAGWSM